MPASASVPVVLAFLFLAGCGSGGGKEDDSGPTQGTFPDSLVTPEADTPGESSPTQPLAPAAVSQPGGLQDQSRPDTIPENPGEPGDSLSVTARLEGLEAENDSLRVALGTLMDLLARGVTPQAPGSEISRASEPPPDTAGVERDILPVDAEQVQHWGLRIAVSVFFLLLGGAFIRLVIWVLDKLAERNAKRRLFFKRLVPIARISLWFLAILFTSLVILRIEAQGLIAAGAAVGVAVGFAAQDILKNIFGGLIVLFDQPFQVGDKISVEGTYGEVVSIGLRSTRIVTPDDNLVSVPNAQVVGGQVANANAGELNCQVVTDLFLPGWVDETKAKRIAFEAAASSRYVFLNKPIVVLVKDEFRETFLTHLKVKAYVLDPRYEFLFQSDVTERARGGFREAGLLGPMHGVRAYIDLDRVSGKPPGGDGGGKAEE
jgi:small-conductance mechanosensitive channel